jgi:hypothetical protein
LLDMINICKEKNLFEIICDFHGWNWGISDITNKAIP